MIFLFTMSEALKVLVVVAHPDDEVLGVGGTIRKITKRGGVVKTVICSNGDAFPFWVSKEEVVKRRREEALKADKILGVSETIFLGLKDTKLKKSKRMISEKVLELLKEFKPDRVFTHYSEDTHKDHKSVHFAVRDAVIKYGEPVELLSFEVNSWGFLSTLTILKPSVLSKKPQIVVNVEDVYEDKLKALKQFRSQRLILKIVFPLILLKEIYYGVVYGFKYAEHFYKYL